jgi:hypothetical protein
MLLKLVKLFKILKNAQYLNNKNLNKKLIIFDCMSIETLKMYLLKNFDYFVISNRPEKIKLYFSINLFVLFIKKYIKFISNKELLIQDIYFLALIEIIHPGVVLTAIDVNVQFSKLSKYTEKNIKFVTLQLTNFPLINYITYLFGKKILKKNLNQDFYFPLYLGFGKHQKNNMEKNLIKVDKFVSVGSIKLANFLKSNNSNIQKKNYDVCLISDHNAYTDKFGPDKIQFDNLREIENNFIKLTKWTIKLVKEKKLKFIFVFKRIKENKKLIFEEKQYFKKNLNQVEYNFLINNCSYNTEKNSQNSYVESFRSKISLAVTSTLLTENLIAGNKILSCNFTGLDFFNFSINGICSLKKCNYLKFKNRVIKIIKINKNKYFNMLSKNKNYIASAVNPDETIDTIKKEICKYL